MSWTSPFPAEAKWKPADMFAFLREIFTRGRCFGSFTWDPGEVAAATTLDTTLTTTDATAIKGTRVGMQVSITPPSTLNTGLGVVGAWVATDDQLTIRLMNATAGAINPGSATWVFSGRIV